MCNSHLRDWGNRLVFTNGCFDLLHAGHVWMLQFARGLGDELIVGLNSDASVRRLKGPTRPIIPQDQRKFLLESLVYVTRVVIFDDSTPLALIRQLRPAVYVKGPEYRGVELPEARLIVELGGRVVIPPRSPYGVSTREIVNAIRGAD